MFLSQVATQIKHSVHDLGKACGELVQAAGVVQSSPTDTYSKKALVLKAKNVPEKVAFVLASLQAGARGTQACINAHTGVQGIIGDLDTMIMFATAGTLNPENDRKFAELK